MPVKWVSKEYYRTRQDSLKQNIRLILQVYERRKPQHLSVCISGKKISRKYNTIKKIKE
jgi:hypothetical protein